MELIICFCKFLVTKRHHKIVAFFLRDQMVSIPELHPLYLVSYAEFFKQKSCASRFFGSPYAVELMQGCLKLKAPAHKAGSKASRDIVPFTYEAGLTRIEYAAGCCESAVSGTYHYYIISVHDTLP